MNKAEIFSFFKTILIALMCAGIIRSFWFEPFHIPSGSMKPNLLVGDYIIVTKYSYGYSRYSFPFGFDFFSGRKIFHNKPQRGDVAVFRFTQDTSINYIKRVIGLPGDKIQMKGGVLYINGEKVEKIYDKMFVDNQDGIISEIRQFKEIMPDKKQILTLDAKDNELQDDTQIYEVPENKYFVMGDNRDNSQDSRFQLQLGFVPEENFVGKARFIFFSTSKPIWKIWLLGQSFRYDRFFKKID